MEAMLFGVNILLILIMQEKDSLTGEIKWSILPLAVNNTYMMFTNLQRYYSDGKKDEHAASPSSSSTTLAVNKDKVAYGIVWYIGTMVGYAMMESHGQGLALKSSQDMLFFTASETVFMVSMGMCYFYGW